MPSEDKIVKLSQARTLYNDLRGRIEDVVTNQIATIDTSKADKVTGATNGNFAALDSNGNLADSNYSANDFAPIIYKEINNQSVISVTDGADNMPIHNLIAKIEPVQSGNGDPSPENVRPIYGWTGANVVRTGKNLAKLSYASSSGASTKNFTYNSVTVYSIATTAAYRSVAFYIADVSMLAGKTMTFSAKAEQIIGNTAPRIIAGYYKNDVKIGSNIFEKTGTTFTHTMTIPSNVETGTMLRINLYCNSNVSGATETKFTDIQLEIGSTITAFEPYGTTYPIAWQTEAGTVYGGTLDVTNGVLTVNRANIESYNGETLPGAWISDRDVYAEGTTPTTGAQVVYELAIPTTYQLTPAEITTLLGTNNIWADTGNVSVLYPVDTKSYVDNSIPDVPVTDVQVNGTSIISSGVANVPLASTLTPGVARVDASYGISIGTAGLVAVVSASSNQAKLGTETYKPITPSVQNVSTFYGLAKAAGDTTQAQSENGVGVYADSAKTKIQNMLNVPSANAIASLETNSTATKNYSIGDLFTMDGKLYKVTAAIAQNGAIVTEGNGQNCEEVNVASEFARSADIPTVPVQDVQVNGTSVLSNGIANVPLCGGASVPGVVKADGDYGITIAVSGGATGKLYVSSPSNAQVKAGTNQFKPIVPSVQHTSVFYGLAKAAGDTTQAQSENAIGTYTNDAKSAIRTMIGAGTPLDVQINSSSIVSSGVANIPVAGTSTYGVIKVNYNKGFSLENGTLIPQFASESEVKAGTNTYKPLVSLRTKEIAFYGLAKAAGDSTQSSSSNAVGIYTESAKSAISQMLNAPVTVSGTTPTITAKAGIQYVCGEVSTLTIVVPESGCIDVIFESGSTPTVLTVTPPTGKTMKWPDWFNPSTLEANAAYEINVLNGTLGEVGVWT